MVQRSDGRLLGKIERQEVWYTRAYLTVVVPIEAGIAKYGKNIKKWVMNIEKRSHISFA